MGKDTVTLAARSGKIVLLLAFGTVAFLSGRSAFRHDAEPAQPSGSSESQVASSLRNSSPSAASSAPASGGQRPVTLELLEKQFGLVSKESDPLRKKLLFCDFLSQASPGTLSLLRQVVEANYGSGGRLPNDLSEMFHFRCGQLMQPGAFAGLIPQEPNGNLDDVTRKKFRGLASIDSATSLALIAALEPGAVKDRLQKDWYEGLAGESLRSAFDLMPPEGKAQVMEKYVGQLFDRGGMSSVNGWFEQLSTNPASDTLVLQKAFNEVASRLAQNGKDIQVGIRFVMEHAKEPYFSMSSINSLNYNTARWNPGQSFEMLGDFQAQRPDLASQVNDQVRLAVRQASSTSLNSVATWLNAHPESPMRDVAARHLAEQLKNDDPESATYWAKSIKDSGLRSQALNAVGVSE